MTRINHAEGIYENMPFSEYLNSAAWSCSDLRTLDEDNEGCPALLKYHRENPEDEDKECFLVGRALHAFVLENRRPWVVQPETYICAQGKDAGKSKPWSNNAEVCRAWRREQKAAGIDVLTATQEAHVLAWGSAILASESCRKLLDVPGRSELTVIMRDPVTNLLLRIRIDWCPDVAAFNADIKTTLDASPAGFGSSAASLKYECQGWLYNYVYNLAAEKYGLPKKTDWIHLAVRKPAPHFAQAYHMQPMQFFNGERLMRKWMAQLQQCVEQDNWPAYAENNEVSPLTYPSWWSRKLDKELE